MAQNYGIKAIRPLNDNPHVFGFESARTGDDETLLEIWNGASIAALVLGIQKDGQIRGVDGSEALPTYGFESDEDSGLYLSDAGDLRAAVAGSDVLQLVAAAVRTLQVLELLDGSAGTPALSFADDTDTGLYSVAANVLGIAANGALALRVAEDSVRVPTQVVSDRHDNGSTPDVDFEDGNTVAITLDANKTITLTGAVAGGQYCLELIQDATGGRTVTWPANVEGDAGGSPPQPDSTADRTSLVYLFYNGSSYAAADGGAYDL
ncbi:MAG: hypothetical protein ACODAB_10375 [Gemmatimonadota bacterium]